VVLHNCEITTSLEPDFLHIQQYTCDFEIEKTGSLSETDYCSLVGLSKQFFDELSKEVEPYRKNTPARSIRISLAIYLCKMKFVPFFYENISSIKNDDSLCVIHKKRLC
jgi:hypothetical protein